MTVWIFQDGNLNGLFDVASAGPIVSFLPILLIGILFGLAMGLPGLHGILADAFLVRLTLVPAVMALLGPRAWWMPRRVERIVPNFDIEGENLAKGLA